MRCPDCGKTIKAVKITEKQTKYGMLQKFRCPDCGAWLSLKTGPTIIKSIGLVLTILGSVVGMLQPAPNNIVFAGIAFCGAVLALIATNVNKPNVVK